MARKVIARLREEGGFGLAELVIALAVLSISLMVLVGAFSSAAVAMKRATAISTAGVIADSQMERYRGMTWDYIGLNTSATTDATYKADVACVGGSTCTNTAPTAGSSACQSGGIVYTTWPLNCTPTNNVVGPDSHSYRLDTYVRLIQSVVQGNPRQTKIVTIVVRDIANGNHVLAREESDFDYCTGLPNPSGTSQSC